jgi:hypothetical protein
MMAIRIKKECQLIQKYQNNFDQWFLKSNQRIVPVDKSENNINNSLNRSNKYLLPEIENIISGQPMISVNKSK